MIISEPFAIGTSRIHSLDPRIRVALAILFSVVTALSKQFASLSIALLVALLLVGLAELNLFYVGKRLLTVFGFLILIWLLLPVTYEGKALYQMGPLSITQPGIVLSAQITLKSLAILMAFMSLVATMSIATLGHTLNRLKFPDKLVHLLLITYRYIFVIQEEYQRLRNAIKVRGFRPGTNLHSYKTFAYLVGMLFVRASVRAERVNRAMKCRGFKGRFYSLDEFSSYKPYWLLSILMLIAMGLMVLLEWRSL